jgi:phosphoglycerate dehydrogenase-like enzyme
MDKPRASILITREMERRCFAEEDLRRLDAATALQRAETDSCSDDGQLAAIAGAEIAVTGWGSRPITQAMLDAATGLKLLCHSAGSVKSLIDAEQFLRRGIRVCTARQALAVGVAEFAFGMMLVSMKGVWWKVRGATWSTAEGGCTTAQRKWDRSAMIEWIREPYGATVGIIGASNVGREMIRLCKTLSLAAILLYDPYVSEAEARDLGTAKVDLDELMRRSDVVSLHTPATEECRHLIDARNLALLKDHAIFINTARGMCVDEQALIAELEKRRILACIDVTDPEPPAEDSPLYKLPNCILTPHIAGAVKENTFRQGRLVADQIEAYVRGTVLRGELDLKRHHVFA